MHIILTHTNADFDALASMLGACKLNPGAVPVLPPRLNSNVEEFLALYRGDLPFVDHQELNRREKISRITLTDTQSFDAPKGVKPDTPVHIIEHHRPMRDSRPYETLEYHEIGAITTYLVEQIQGQAIPLTALEATLLALGIYEDTGMLTYSGTTVRDVRSVAWLLEQGAVLDTLRRFLSHSLDDEQQRLLDVLLQNTENLTIHGYPIALSVAQADKNISGINGVAAYLRDMLNAAALFVAVEMPGIIQLVCRSVDDAIDVDAVAALFGGGGHVRAAAAAVHGRTPAEVCDMIKTHLYEHVRPAIQVADLMSYNPRTVHADDMLKDLIPVIRRIGHEGYPVLENGRVVGLLTLRDADRAIEHGLSKATVREVMQAGSHTVTPAASIPELEQLMVTGGWGQIPVVDENGSPVGIVTRTDLLKHRAQAHPAITSPPAVMTLQEIEKHLGENTARLIRYIAERAHQEQLVLYMVGGVVRDLLLGQSNQDIDFVVEGHAIAFAQKLCREYGGRIHAHQPFGTAKWYLENTHLPGIEADALPEHVDFVTARNEFYAHPTALPTVYSASIRLDMARRDFTINTLAVQLSPAGAIGRILDIFGGMADLQQRLIRVLHSLSFVDDPTRILRAVRFSERLRFTIEPRTAELIHTALPVLRRITGERIRNELTFILQETEPERCLLKLEALRVLPAIYPALHFLPDIAEHFRGVRNDAAPPLPDRADVYWFVWLVHLDNVAELCERLMMGANKTRLYIDGARLFRDRAMLTDTQLRPGQVIAWLEKVEAEALRLIPLVLDDAEKRQLEYYRERARTLRPFTDGNTLKSMGLPPGRQYKIILEALRNAWLDGEVQNETDEMTLLQRLIREHY